MTTPCVIYIHHSQFGHKDITRFRGNTSRNERIRGTITAGFICDPVNVTLDIDDVVIEAPAGLDFCSAYTWIVNQVADLGYHVIEMSEPTPSWAPDTIVH